MNITEANAVNTVLEWAMAQVAGRRPVKNGALITDDMATEAGKLLAARAQKALMAGLGPDEVELRANAGPHQASGTCPALACSHLWSLHGPGGCTGKVFPAHSLAGQRCPCEHAGRAES